MVTTDEVCQYKELSHYEDQCENLPLTFTVRVHSYIRKISRVGLSPHSVNTETLSGIISVK